MAHLTTHRTQAMNNNRRTSGQSRALRQLLTRYRDLLAIELQEDMPGIQERVTERLVRLMEEDSPSDSDSRTHRRPRLFLSYPSCARLSAQLLKQKLESIASSGFEVHDFVTSDCENELERVRLQIQQCDYFIGLWFCDDNGGSQSVTVPPLLTFEYGIAFALGVSCMIVMSTHSLSGLWSRIGPGTTKSVYADIQSSEETVANVLKVCEAEWLPQWQMK